MQWRSQRRRPARRTRSTSASVRYPLLAAGAQKRSMVRHVSPIDIESALPRARRAAATREAQESLGASHILWRWSRVAGCRARGAVA